MSKDGVARWVHKDDIKIRESIRELFNKAQCCDTFPIVDKKDIDSIIPVNMPCCPSNLEKYIEKEIRYNIYLHYTRTSEYIKKTNIPLPEKIAGELSREEAKEFIRNFYLQGEKGWNETELEMIYRKNSSTYYLKDDFRNNKAIKYIINRMEVLELAENTSGFLCSYNHDKFILKEKLRLFKRFRIELVRVLNEKIDQLLDGKKDTIGAPCLRNKYIRVEIII